MLTDGATIAMPPTATWYRGRDAVAAFLAERPLDGSLTWRLTPTRASGQLAFVASLRDRATGSFLPHHLAVLTLRGTRIDEITTFLDPVAATSHDLAIETDQR
jgi:RNA polymerase sigma-70 factor (ECF subfamily)